MGAGCLSNDYIDFRNKKLAALNASIVSSYIFGEKARIDKEDFQHRLLIGTFLAMHELAESIHLLVQNDKVLDAEILLRSLMDLRVRIEAFAKDRGIAEREKIEFLRHNIRQLEEALTRNPYLSEIEKHFDIEEELLDLSRKMADLQASGVKGQLDLKTLCVRFGFIQEYSAIYSGLSQAPHGTYASIIKRNFVIDHEKGTWAVVGFRVPDKETLDVVCHQSADWLDEARAILQTFLEASDIRQP